MFTNLGADPALVEEARRIGKHTTKTAAIRAALQEYVQRHRQVTKPGAGGRRRDKH